MIPAHSHQVTASVRASQANRSRGYVGPIETELDHLCTRDELDQAFSGIECVRRDLDIPEAKFNVNGGAVALGHPIGASGARLLVTLLYALRARSKRRGVVSLCLGGGEAVALAIELL